MKNLVLAAIIFFVAQVCFAQSDSVKRSNEEPEVFIIVEKMPSWKGCESLKTEEKRSKCTAKELANFLTKNLKYPVNAKTANIEGTVYITFKINEIGIITNPKVLRGVNEEMDEEALRVIKLMPNWNPGRTFKGEIVAVQYNLPIEFILGNSSNK